VERGRDRTHRNARVVDDGLRDCQRQRALTQKGNGAGNYHYMATFAGFVPAEDPQLSAIVVLDEPTATIFASGASAPVFSRIASYALRRFHIPPPGVNLPPTVPAPTHVSSTQVNDVTGGKPNPPPGTDTSATTVPPTTATESKKSGP